MVERLSRYPALPLLLAVVVALPTLAVRFHLDDWWQLAVLETHGAWEALGSLFRFAPPDPRAAGAGPWWADPELRLSFWRPLSAATMVLDHRLFGPHRAWAWHLHSIGWWVAVVWAASRLYRRVAPELALLAAILLSVDEVCFTPVGWLANRNALVSAAPALLGLVAHLRAREDGWTPGRVLGPLGLGVGLLGGEAAFGVFAYLLAYEVAGARDGLGARVRGLLPAIALGIGYLAVHKAFGHGANASGAYVDPLGEPVRWLVAAPGRALANVAALTTTAPADAWYLYEWTRPLLVALGVAGALGWAALVRRSRDDRDDDEERAVRWLGLGALLSIVPVLAIFPANRLLLLPAVGASFVLAAILRHWWRFRWTERDPGDVHRVVCGLLVLTSLGVAPVSWIGQSAGLRRISDATIAGSVDVELGPEVERAVVLAATDAPTGFYAPLVRKWAGEPVPDRWDVVSIVPRPHRVRRVAEDAVEIEVVGGRWLDTEFERIVRGPARPLAPGDRIAWDGLVIEVLAASDGRPERLRVELDRPLGDPSLALLAPVDGKLVRLVPTDAGDVVAEP